MIDKPDILVDIDGCFANFILGSLDAIRESIDEARRSKYTSIGHEDIHSYAMEAVFDMTPDEIARWHTLVRMPGYCAAIPPYPGARFAIARLQEIGNVHPVTFPWPRAPHWIIEREDWLREHLGIDPDLVHYTRQKHLVRGAVFIEDTTKYLVKWRKHNPDGIAIRLSRPYNRSEPFTEGITVSTFDELVNRVEAALDLRERRRRAVYDD
jgi:5'(3')-deoxyribonucleotidase